MKGKKDEGAQFVRYFGPLLIGEQALKFFIQLYEVERQVHQLDAGERKRIRQERSRPVADALHLWLTQQRLKVPEGSATIKAIDYSLGSLAGADALHRRREPARRQQLVENQIRPIAIGRSNWLFAGSLRADQRAAAIMSLVHSARLNGHDTLRVSEGCAAASANPAGQPCGRTVAAPLDTESDRQIPYRCIDCKCSVR